MKNTAQASLDDLVESGIREFLDELPNSGLYDPVRYVMDMGGKRLRPKLCLMGCQLFEGDIERATAPALALELLHNFTLVHDDIMDSAPLRRGNATVHTKWNENTAILSGDALMIKAYQQIQKAGDRALPNVMALFNKTALEVCEGQQLDMEFEERENVSKAEYLEMIRLKTSVLIGCALKMGAVMAHAPGDQADAIYRFGENLGMAFQIKDDMLDAFGNADKFGKRKGGDIVSGKHTLLRIEALERASTNKEELEKLFTLPDERAEEKVSRVLEYYQQLGVYEVVNSEMETHYQNAIAELEGLNVAEENKSDLRFFAKALFNRDH